MQRFRPKTRSKRILETFCTQSAGATLTLAQCVQQAADNKQEQGSTTIIKHFIKKTKGKASKEKNITLGYNFYHNKAINNPIYSPINN
jgi:hypothetical protein